MPGEYQQDQVPSSCPHMTNMHNEVCGQANLLLPCSAPARTSLALAVLLLVRIMTGFFVSCPGWVGNTSLDSAPACSHAHAIMHHLNLLVAIRGLLNMVAKIMFMHTLGHW